VADDPAATANPPSTINPPVFSEGLTYTKHAPILKNPVAGRIDQAWLYGESYGDLPLQTGVCFIVPEDTLVMASATGVVEMVTPPGQSPPGNSDPDIIPYPGMVILRHDEPKIGGEPIWTVYARMQEIFVAPGEKVARDEVLGKTGRPYDGSPESRATAFLFEVRAGRNSVHKSLNPSPIIDHVDARKTGMLALQIVDENRLGASGVEVRGITKSRLHPRYGYSLTYLRGVNPHPDLQENLIIADIPEGRHQLRVGKNILPITIRPGEILQGVWMLMDE